ncbi:MAG TPA: PDZ domain-containing protein [Halanaerobiales bacterium]|nr:PDZ domain-containing protein [Halanaerobiales bacterium]
MKRRIESLTKLFIIFFVFIVIINLIPVNYILVKPGIAQELSPLVTVENGFKGGSKGDFMLTAVSTSTASVWDIIYINIIKPSNVIIEPIDKHIPAGLSFDEYLEIMDKYMEDSQLKSQAIAFQKAGYPVIIDKKGVFVSKINEKSKAKGKLKEADKIIAINDTMITNNQDITELLYEYEIGDEIKLSVEREDRIIDYHIETIETEETPGKASIGIIILTDYEYKFPRKVIFNTRDIAGSSAGTMFALEIFNQLTEEDITKGRRIAGTGTISLEGTVGRIDSVQQKIIAAEKNNADLFILPVENYEEITGIKTNLTLIPVNSFDDIISYLEKTDNGN